MKKIHFTKKTIFILIVGSIICLFIEPIGYKNIYLNPLDITWKRIIFRLVGILILLSAKPYFPDKPESLRKWLYFMATAFFLKILGQLVFKIYMNSSVILLLYIAATIFFLLALLESIRAYRNLSTSTARKT
jgi:hypothetical protein